MLLLIKLTTGLDLQYFYSITACTTLSCNLRVLWQYKMLRKIDDNRQGTWLKMGHTRQCNSLKTMRLIHLNHGQPLQGQKGKNLEKQALLALEPRHSSLGNCNCLSKMSMHTKWPDHG